MQMISAAQVTEILDMRSCIDLMKTALISLSEGEAIQMVRPVLSLYDRNVLGMMPAYYGPGKVAGIKVLTVFPENYRQRIPSHQGQVLVFEAENGRLKAIVDAEAITAIRTAAASAVVTQALARPEASRLAILGAGLQGRQHLRAISLVRSLQAVSVWDIDPEAAIVYAEEMGKETGLPVRACATVVEATEEADIICTLTPSLEPILFADHVQPGAHINAVGACAPHARELASDLVAASRLFVDWKEAAMKEAGDYLLALQEGVITAEHILGEVGQVLTGKLPGRLSTADITIFESLGQAIQDLLAANYVAEGLEEGVKE